MQVRDLLFIIIGERRAILRGLIMTFFAVLPFTFLPLIVKHGFVVDVIVARANVSMVYSFCFSLLVVIVAVVYNYEGLADRKWYFDRPAFRHLEFRGRVDGVDSTVRDLETFLLGETEGYYFRLSLVDTDSDNARLEIIPAVILTDKDQEVKILKAEYGFRQRVFLSTSISLNEIDLNDKNSIKTILEYNADV